MTRAAAVVSMVLRREAEALETNGSDLGVVSALNGRDAIVVRTNAVCCFGGNNSNCDATPASLAQCLADNTCDTCADEFKRVILRPSFGTMPDDSYWKFSTAHEIGHIIQGQLKAIPQNRYDITEPPRLVPPPKCACNHVTTANALHCLQSLEDPGPAQVEGFGQAFASRIFNRAGETDCVFKYYKEFLNDTCMPGAPAEACVRDPKTRLMRTSPPIPVDCVHPVRWRNNQCFDDTVRPGELVTDLGTEYDWMSFLYRGMTEAPSFSATELFAVYRTACGGECSSTQRVTWEGCSVAGCLGLRAAADAFFTAEKNDLEPGRRFARLGNEHGVSQSTER